MAAVSPWGSLLLPSFTASEKRLRKLWVFAGCCRIVPPNGHLDRVFGRAYTWLQHDPDLACSNALEQTLRSAGIRDRRTSDSDLKTIAKLADRWFIKLPLALLLLFAGPREIGLRPHFL